MPFNIVHSAEDWSKRFGADSRVVLAIGTFDGVHCGHRKILECVVERARRENCLAAALTFSPHPLRVLRPQSAPPLIETVSQRLGHMEQLGLSAVFVMHFDHALASMSPEEFVERILVNALHARMILVGENFRFGNCQAGDVELLARLGRSFDFAVERVPPVTLRHNLVSSTAVRNAVSAGNMAQAARLLGRPFALSGEIRPGTGTGRRFVFPTLNLSSEQELIPARGVYATEAILGGRSYRAATNVGVRPTFDGSHLAIESHLLGFSEEITSGPLEVHFWLRLRDEQKFSGPDALRAQIARDLDQTRSFFSHLDAARRLWNRV